VQVNRVISNNKSDTINRDNEKGECTLTDIAISGERNNIKKKKKKILKYKAPYKRNTTKVECKNKSDTSNNRGKWNNLKIIQKISVKYTGKAQNHGITENSHIEHCIHISESNNIKVQTNKHGI
jgi:hypothetical protein